MMQSARAGMLARSCARFALSAFFVLAGLNHFIMPEAYRPLMPPSLPFPMFLIALSGVLEIFFGALVLLPTWRHRAGWGLVLLLLAVFPANVHMALDPEVYPAVPLALRWLRLPLQLLLIAWVAWACFERPYFKSGRK
jgi:uncharacterized membrane protein